MEFDIVELFVDFALLGAEWVMYLLVALSVLSIGVMIDRVLWFRGRDGDSVGFVRELRRAWREDELAAFVERHKSSPSISVQVALAGVSDRTHGADAVAEAMQAERSRWRKEGERNLIILGTLGNNTPFIGLFGTVLGIIAALQKLGGDGTETDVVRELSEALVATAIGLGVAIPAVVAYNYFTRRLKVTLSGGDEAAHAVLGLMHGDEHAAKKAEGA